MITFYFFILLSLSSIADSYFQMSSLQAPSLFPVYTINSQYFFFQQSISFIDNLLSSTVLYSSSFILLLTELLKIKFACFYLFYSKQQLLSGFGDISSSMNVQLFFLITDPLQSSSKRLRSINFLADFFFEVNQSKEPGFILSFSLLENFLQLEFRNGLPLPKYFVRSFDIKALKLWLFQRALLLSRVCIKFLTIIQNMDSVKFLKSGVTQKFKFKSLKMKTATQSETSRVLKELSQNVTKESQSHNGNGYEQPQCKSLQKISQKMLSALPFISKQKTQQETGRITFPAEQGRFSHHLSKCSKHSKKSKLQLSSHNVSFEDRSEPLPFSQKRSRISHITNVKYFLIPESEEFSQKRSLGKMINIQEEKLLGDCQGVKKFNFRKLIGVKEPQDNYMQRKLKQFEKEFHDNSKKNIQKRKSAEPQSSQLILQKLKKNPPIVPLETFLKQSVKKYSQIQIEQEKIKKQQRIKLVEKQKEVRKVIQRFDYMEEQGKKEKSAREKMLEYGKLHRRKMQIKPARCQICKVSLKKKDKILGQNCKHKFHKVIPHCSLQIFQQCLKQSEKCPVCQK